MAKLKYLFVLVCIGSVTLTLQACKKDTTLELMPESRL